MTSFPCDATASEASSLPSGTPPPPQIFCFRLLPRVQATFPWFLTTAYQAGKPDGQNMRWVSGEELPPLPSPCCHWQASRQVSCEAPLSITPCRHQAGTWGKAVGGRGQVRPVSNWVRLASGRWGWWVRRGAEGKVIPGTPCTKCMATPQNRSWGAGEAACLGCQKAWHWHWLL